MRNKMESSERVVAQKDPSEPGTSRSAASMRMGRLAARDPSGPRSPAQEGTDFYFLGAPTDTWISWSGEDRRTMEVNAGDAPPLCDGKYDFEEVGSVFEDLAPYNITIPELKPPAAGTELKKYNEVAAKHPSTGKQDVYKAGDYVYLTPLRNDSMLHICKVECFLSYGAQGMVGLFRRYVRASHPMLSNLGVDMIKGEVFETDWYSFKWVDRILSRADVASTMTSATHLATQPHICRYVYDYKLHKVESIHPPVPQSEIEDECDKGGEDDVAKEKTAELTADQQGMLRALELITTPGGDNTSNTSQAGEDETEVGAEDDNQQDALASLVCQESAFDLGVTPPYNNPVQKENQVQKESQDKEGVKGSAVPMDLDPNQVSVQLPPSPARKRKISEISVVTKSSFATFPLQLSSNVKARWTQERYQNGQRYLFQSLMNQKAFGANQSVTRQQLRNHVKTLGIGDLGLIDHIIKTLTERRVVFSGQFVRKQHDDKGILKYWLSPAAEIPALEASPMSMQVPCSYPSGPRSAPGGLQSPYAKISLQTLEAPKSVLSTLKEIRTTLVSLQDQVSQIASRGQPKDPKDLQKKSDEWTYNILLQHLEEDIEKTAQRLKEDLANHRRQGPGQEEVTQLRDEMRETLDRCVSKEKENAEEIKNLSTQLNRALGHLIGVQKDVRALQEDKSAPESLNEAVGNEMKAFREEIALMKAQQELFLKEGSARIDEVVKENAQLKEQIEALTER